MKIDLKTSVSFADINARIKQYLDQNENFDLSNLSAVSLLVDAVSAGIEVSKFEVLRALQESFIHTANLPDSIYQLIDTLHVQLSSKSPCYSEMTISSRELTRIPAYTQFVSGDINLYNRVRATANVEPSNIEVFEGKVIQESFIVEDNRPRITLKYDKFRVSLEDIVVKIGNTTWNRFDGDEYKLSATDQTFLIDVNYKGEVKIYFGTGTFGAVPPIGSQVEVTYAVTKGLDGSQSIQGMLFNSQEFPTLTCYGVGSLLGGDNERDAEFLKEYGPWISASKEWASRKKDFMAIASKFPGVIDCSIQNQADLDPDDRDLENFIQVTLITNDIWTSNSWTKLEQRLKERSSERLHFIRKDAVPIMTDWGFIIYCRSNANLDSVKKNAINAINQYLSKKPKCLMKTVRMADVETILKASDTDISTYTRLYPNIDYENLSYYEYILANEINIEARYE